MAEITIKIDSQFHQELSDVLAPYNLNVEQAIVLFIEEVAKQGRIPFEYTEADVEEARNSPLITIVEGFGE